MSTDDSISEDVSSSVALSHDHTSANGGKGSEASMVSSEDTVSGLVVPEEELPSAPTVQALEGFLQTPEGPVMNRPPTSPACNISHKIRNLCLRTEEEFSSGRSLPFINPSSLETLRALVQEIQSSGETDPEIWKNCEGRWLHLFQLVEKQYQEQILAQQEQYQCQIQLIQDEIKALVQLQNRQSGTQSHTQDPSPHAVKDTRPPEDLKSGSNVAQSTPRPPGSQSPPRGSANPGESSEDYPATVLLSSGYATLTTWEQGLEPGAPGAPDRPTEGRDEVMWSPNQQDHSLARSPLQDTSLTGRERQRSGSGAVRDAAQTASHPGQPLTSWAQRQRRRQRKSKLARESPPQVAEREQARAWSTPKEQTHNHDDHACTAASVNPVPLKRTDSTVSEASGLTYWKLDESELYRPLPDSFDSGAFLLLQDATMSQTLQEEPRVSVSLKEIYQSKQREGQDWDLVSNASSPQVFTLDPTVHVRHSDRTSGFTSPSRFSSPSLLSQPQAFPSGGAPVSPDSMALRSHTDTDCTSNSSSLSAQQVPDRTAPPAAASTSPAGRGAQRANSEDDGSHTATLTQQTRLTAGRDPREQQRVGPGSGSGRLERTTSLEDPVVLSLLRQNLREKHSRHIADLRAYYEAEISALKEKLDLVDLPLDMEKGNRVLQERCEHLERALTEAGNRIQELENKNRLLERQLAEWPERYSAASGAVEALQQRLEESKRSSREKDGAASKMKARLRQLEETVQKACREADEKEARMKTENRMLQDLLLEYDSLRKEYEGMKDNLVAAEDKLFDANEQISELKRVISKLEAQVKQLEHENLAKTRQAAHAHAQPSGAGLFHHPDLLLSPGKRQRDLESSIKKSSGPWADVTSGQPSDRAGLSVRGLFSSPESENVPDPPAVKEPVKRDVALTPVMKALIQMEETKATEGRALSKNNWNSLRLGRRRPTVGFVESCVREPVPERTAGLLRTQRSLSPEGSRSSSLPPRAQRTGPLSTPTKRETLLTPLSAKSSPKRCPSENFSTALGHPLPSPEHLRNRFDVHFDQKDLHSSYPSPRKRLQYMPPDRQEAVPQCRNGSGESVESGESEEHGGRSAWEEQEATGGPSQFQDPADEVPSSYQTQVHSLADAERLFDELTQEKQQIEAALSRIPGAGSRVTLQTRLDEVTLENRLEKVNRELGSIRMTLKRFNILRSSANL